MTGQILRQIDNAFITHTHSDHVTGVKALLDSSSTYYITSKSKPVSGTISTPKTVKIDNKSGLTAKIYPPLQNYSSTNNCSMLVKFHMGTMNFVFSGDIFKGAIENILASNEYTSGLRSSAGKSTENWDEKYNNAIKGDGRKITGVGNIKDHSKSQSDTTVMFALAGLDAYRDVAPKDSITPLLSVFTHQKDWGITTDIRTKD